MKLKDLKVGDKFYLPAAPGTYIKKSGRKKNGYYLVGTGKPYTDLIGFSGETEVILSNSYDD